jgi:hypothetical protein
MSLPRIRDSDLWARPGGLSELDQDLFSRSVAAGGLGLGLEVGFSARVTLALL